MQSRRITTSFLRNWKKVHRSIGIFDINASNFVGGGANLAIEFPQ